MTSTSSLAMTCNNWLMLPLPLSGPLAWMIPSILAIFCSRSLSPWFSSMVVRILERVVILSFQAAAGVAFRRVDLHQLVADACLAKVMLRVGWHRNTLPTPGPFARIPLVRLPLIVKLRELTLSFFNFLSVNYLSLGMHYIIGMHHLSIYITLNPDEFSRF